MPECLRSREQEARAVCAAEKLSHRGLRAMKIWGEHERKQKRKNIYFKKICKGRGRREFMKPIIITYALRMRAMRPYAHESNHPKDVRVHATDAVM